MQYVIEDSVMSSIADAIRAKTGTSEAFQVTDMASAIENIPSGGGSEFKNYVEGTLSEVDDPTVTKIASNIFANNSGLKYVSFPNASIIGTSAFCSCSKLSYINIENATTIGSSAFNSCSALNSVILNLTSSHTLYSFAFKGCSNITQINGISQLSIIRDYTFASCSKLFNNEPVELEFCTNIGTECFIDCRSLTSITGSLVTSIGTSAFNRCINLSYVSFPNCVSIGMEAFNKCAFSEISLPNVTTVNTGAFQNNTELKNITLSLITLISYNVFIGCTSLSEISVPLVTSIAQYAFMSCPLNGISLPRCTYIQTSAFDSCGLKFVYAPLVKNILANAFKNNKRLESIYLGESKCTLGNTNAFTNTPIANSSYLGYFGSIYVPSEYVDAYKSATNWVTYADRITAIP